MNASEVFAAVAAQRRAFADLIESLADAQLQTPSLCGVWNVQAVAGHVAFAAAPQQARFGYLLLRHGLNFDRANDEAARRWATRPVREIVARIRDQAESRFHPPGALRAPLADITIHTQDVARPLDLDISPPEEDLAAVLDFVKDQPFGFGRRGTTRGLRLTATDLDVSWGDGPAVQGPGLDLLLAITGRHAGLAGLTGDGVQILSQRL